MNEAGAWAWDRKAEVVKVTGKSLKKHRKALARLVANAPPQLNSTACEQDLTGDRWLPDNASTRSVLRRGKN
jgi:hypothetical protein